MYRRSPFRSTLNTGYITGLDMCKVCTEAVHCVALWTRVTLGLGMCKVCTEAVHCVALWTRVTLGLGMCPCQVCTEARDATKNAKKKSPKAKTRPGKKGTKARKGCVSGSANVPVCGYIYIYVSPHISLATVGPTKRFFVFSWATSNFLPKQPTRVYAASASFLSMTWANWSFALFFSERSSTCHGRGELLNLNWLAFGGGFPY